MFRLIHACTSASLIYLMISGANAAPMPATAGAVAPMIVESGNWSSYLTFVNESKSPVHITLTLTEYGGKILAPHSEELVGHSSKRLSLSELLKSSQLMSFVGSVSMRVEEPIAAENMSVAAQATVVGRNHQAGVSVDEEFQMPMSGIMRISFAGLENIVALTNSGKDAASVNISCPNRNSSQQFSTKIPAQQTKFLYQCYPVEQLPLSRLETLGVVSNKTALDLDASQTADSEGEFNHGPGTQLLGQAGMTITSDSASMISAFGVGADLTPRGMRIIPLYGRNLELETSSTTVFGGLPMGELVEYPGAYFQQSIVVSNFSNDTRVVIIRTYGSDEPTQQETATVPVPPLSTQQIPMKVRSNGFGSITVEADGLPGDVVTTLIDQDRQSGALLIPLQKNLGHTQNGGGHPWTRRGSNSSNLVLFNAGETSEKVYVKIGVDGTTLS